jgi:hypothetical protein
MRPGVRVQVLRHDVIWPFGIGLGTPLLAIGYLLLSGAGVVALIVVLFRWAFRPGRAEPAAGKPDKSGHTLMHTALHDPEHPAYAAD